MIPHRIKVTLFGALLAGGVLCSGCAMQTVEKTVPLKGKAIYEQNCIVCHGSHGKGDGYTKFNPSVADLSSPAIQNRMDAELIKSIHQGRSNTAMGSWRFILSEQQIHGVLAYVRTFGK